MRDLARTPSPAALLFLPCCALLFAACQGAQTIPERQHVEGQAPIRLPEPIDIPPPLELPEQAPEPSLPQPRIGGDQKLSFELRGIPLANAIHMIAEKAQVNVYLDAELESLVDASFPSVTLDDALGVLLSQNGLRLIEEPAGVFWVRSDDGTQGQIGTFRVNSIDAGSVAEDLGTLVGSNAKLVINAEQNFVLIDGTARDVELVAEYLKGVDRLKRQVLLEVELVELLLDEDFQVGLSHALTDVGIDGGPNLFSLVQGLTTGDGEFSLTLDNPNVPLSSTLTALQQYVGVNVVSSPRVLAVTKSTAKVEIITEIPYIRQTVQADIGGGVAGSSTTQQVEFKEAGIVMEVTPTIQEGGVIEIRIDQGMSNVIEYFESVPVVDIRNITTVMLVQDQHTVVIGGLQQNTIIEDDTGVPLLMDIPFVGRLFRSDTDAKQKRQLLVFITPRILDSGQAAQLSHKIRQDYSETVRVSGVSAVEEL